MNKRGLILCYFVLTFVLVPFSLAQGISQQDEKDFLSWLRQSAVAIDHIEAGKDFSDLQPLKEILKDVKVVGLGEATHGTREFFQIKHRILEFLVLEMGFNAFALESSYSACQLINEYILNGTGDLATELTGQGYTAWDTEEFTKMLNWLRNHNKGLPEEKKVRFYGLDLWLNEYGRNEVLNYLKKTTPERVATTDSLFKNLSKEEAKWPMGIDSESEKSLLSLLPQMQDLLNYLELNRNELISNSSLSEYNEVMQYCKVMKRWIMANTSALLPPILDKGSMRSIYMAENLLDILDSGPDKKFVVWQHNSHIARGGLSENELNFGYTLSKKIGESYYAFGLEFNQGSFQYRLFEGGDTFSDLKEYKVPPGPEGSLSWYLSKANVGDLILDLRMNVRPTVAEIWLNKPLKVWLFNWAYPGEPEEILKEVDILDRYDGIIFIDNTTKTQPTKNALYRSRNGIGF